MENKKSPGNDEIDEAMAKALERMQNLALGIRDTSTSDENVWYRNLLLGILNSTLLDYRYVEIGTKQGSPHLVAWSCRNLLELKVIATYILASAENAKSFKNDLVVDAKEFYEAISKRHRATHSKLISAWTDVTKEFEGPMRSALEAGLKKEIRTWPGNGGYG